jgi:phosphatidylinositol dimannoside acyltransferase
VTGTLRRVLCWKFFFYELLLPALRHLGPVPCDSVLCGLGRALAVFWPGRKGRLIEALRRAQTALELDGATERLWPALAANTARSLARDYVLDVRSDAAVLDRFEIQGFEHLQNTLASGQGALLVGCHLGAHIAALHWLFRSGFPVRALLQRPHHVSRALCRAFDAAGGPHSQTDLFLRRDLPLAAAVERVIRARAALRDGLAIYLNGDIPWQGPNARPGRFLGQPQRFLAIWTELAVVARAPVYNVFCTHLPGGRFKLEFEAIGPILPGAEDAAVAAYLRQLETRIAKLPAEAVAHLLWPCFGAPRPQDTDIPLSRPMRRVRPSRRNAPAPWSENQRHPAPAQRP